MKEKRQQPRATADTNILAQDINTGHHLGRVVNLSGNGMMLIGQEPVESDVVFQLELELETPHLGQKNLRCGVESLWCSETQRSGYYWAGFQIIGISAEGTELVESLVKSWLSGKDVKQ